MELLLIRHGEMAGDPFIKPGLGVTGCLSEKGVQEAKATAKLLEPLELTHVFSSSYGRALQTAEIATKGKPVSIQILDFLHEWAPNHSLDELPSTEASKIREQTASYEIDQLWKTELGEGTYEMLNRIGPPFLKELNKIGLKRNFSFYTRDESLSEDARIAIFAHGGSLNILASFLMNFTPNPAGYFNFEHTGILRITFNKVKNIYFPNIYNSANL